MLLSFTVSSLLLLGTLLAPAYGAHHYTKKQLDALATRVGKTYWVVSVEGKTLAFLVSPQAKAPSFQPKENESFLIVELVGRAQKKPYYKVRFDSGKEGFVSPEAFLEQLNAGIASVDPLADEKKKASEAEEEERKRLEWIQAQPWSKAVKDAAIARKPVTGMTSNEVRQILGDPSRVVKVRAPNRSSEEQWFYTDGSVLIFYNGMLSRSESRRNQP